MSTLTFGTAQQFDSTEASLNSVAKLTPTKFVIAFQDTTDSNRGKAIVGTIAGTVVTIVDDSAVVFDVGQVADIQVKRLSDTSFVVSYTDVTNVNTAGVVGTVDGVTITFGAAIKIQDGTAADKAGGVAALNSTYVVFGYYDGDNTRMAARLASISGTIITLLGSSTSIDTNGVSAFAGKMATLDSTHIIWAYPYISNLAGVKVLEIDTGTQTIISGARQDVMGGSESRLSIDVFDSMYFIIGGYTRARAGGRSGNEITMGNILALESDARYYEVFALDAYHFGIAYFDDADGDKGRISVGTHSAAALTIDKDAQQFEASDTDHLGACAMTDQLFAIAYKITP